MKLIPERIKQLDAREAIIELSNALFTRGALHERELAHGAAVIGRCFDGADVACIDIFTKAMLPQRNIVALNARLIFYGIRLEARGIPSAASEQCALYAHWLEAKQEVLAYQEAA